MTNEELGQMYSRYGAMVHRRCQRLLGSEVDANDALQETFMRVQRYPPDRVQALLPWLYSVAARVCFDMLAARRRSTPLPARLVGKLKELLGQAAEPAEARVSVGAALEELDPKSREIAVLHFLDGFTQEEVADRTGYSRKTVGIKLRAAQERLRLALADTGLQEGYS